MDDPKVQRLPDRLFKAWINFMCVASKNENRRGTLPNIADVAYRLHVTVPRAELLLSELVDAGLFELVDGIAHSHNWEGRQFHSDSSTERVRSYRKRSRNVSPSVTRNGPDTDTDTDTEQIKNFGKTARGARQRTKAPDVLEITDAMRSWATQNGIVINLEAETAAMLDHHRGKGNLHLDWVATWRTWMRNSKRFGGQNGQRESAEQAKYRRTREASEQLLRLVDEKIERDLSAGD